MYSIASAAASGSTTSSSEPSRSTGACSTASRSGWMFSSAGISGRMAAPSGTSSSKRSAMSASGHGGDDGQLVAVLDGGGQVVEVTDVLVVEVDVDEAAHLPALEDARHDAGVGLAEIVEDGLHRGAAGLDDGLALGVLPHRR